MVDTAFSVSPDVVPSDPLPKVDYIGQLRVALRRPIEASWLPTAPLVQCDEDHALLSAMQASFYGHFPLRLSPDCLWVTLARGFALHVNEHAERLRHRFVSHTGKQTLKVTRLDFQPGEDNPWIEVFEDFSDQLAASTGGLSSLVQADFSTTGPVERAVSNLMAMDTFQSYFEYAMYAGCGVPSITLTGTCDDWKNLRARVQRFADYGLEDWIAALDPVLEQFERAKAGNPCTEFWQSMYRYNSGSGPSVMTGWANVLFPYFRDNSDKLYPNPFLEDWRQRLEVDDQQLWTDRRENPQGVGMRAVPSCFTSVPLSVSWGSTETAMRLVGGLLGMTQGGNTLTIAPECGWVVVYEEPVDALSDLHQVLEKLKTPPSD